MVLNLYFSGNVAQEKHPAEKEHPAEREHKANKERRKVITINSNNH